MKAQELREAKAKMELAILDAVCDAIRDFHRATGLKPSTITVEMTPDHFAGAQSASHLCTSVDARVEL